MAMAMASSYSPVQAVRPLSPSSSAYEEELEDTSFWRNHCARDASSTCEGVVPRQLVFGSGATSPPHTLRRPQSHLRPTLDPSALRPSFVIQHTNCCGVLGPVHAARAIAAGLLGDPAPGAYAHSLAPGSRLVASLRVSNAYGERRRMAADDELEWRKRFYLNRTLEKRGRQFARTLRRASRAALLAYAGSTSTRALSHAAASSDEEESQGDARVGDVAAAFFAPSSPSPRPPSQLERPQQPLQAPMWRRPVYVDRNIPWRRFGASVSGLLAAEVLGPVSAPALLPPTSPVVIPTVFLWDSAGATPQATFAVSGTGLRRPAARPAASAGLQAFGAFERRRPVPESSKARGGLVATVVAGF